MQCTKCHQMYDDHMQYCPYCGAPNEHPAVYTQNDLNETPPTPPQSAPRNAAPPVALEKQPPTPSQQEQQPQSQAAPPRIPNAQQPVQDPVSLEKPYAPAAGQPGAQYNPNAQQWTHRPQQPAPPPNAPMPQWGQSQPPAGMNLAAGFAVTSLCCGIASLLLGMLGVAGIVLGIAGIVFGVLAKKRAVPGQSTGMATAGFVCGIIGLVIGIIVLCAWLSCLAVLGSWNYPYYDTYDFYHDFYEFY